jgi:hypothetical protein
MENIGEKAAADALLAILRRIEAMPGAWHSLTEEELKATVLAAVSGDSDALNTYQSLPDGHIELRIADINGTPHAVVRAARGFEGKGDPYLMIIGPRPGTDRAVVTVLRERPQDAGRH